MHVVKPADRPTTNLPSSSTSIEFINFVITKKNAPAKDKPPLKTHAHFRPIKSANHDPVREPIMPPIKKMDTMEDHSMVSCPYVRSTLYLVRALSRHQLRITSAGEFTTPIL
uniref:Uncharacterized protein n=1 Tax=Photinus pyralis TaxID=7054 RepID=A0A1Y1N8S0_PHOPY